MNDTTSGESESSGGWATWVFNPFHYIAGAPALGVGLAAILAAGCVNWATGSHFDGVLDFHTGTFTPVWIYWIEGPIDWIIVSVLLLLGGMLLSRSRIRIVDVFGTQALARFPALITAILVWPPPVQRASQQLIQATMTMQANAAAGRNVMPSDLFGSIAPFDLVLLGVAVLTMLVMIVWMVALMYRAFAVSCNVSGGKAIGVFIVLLVAAEVISKIVFGVVYHAGA